MNDDIYLVTEDFKIVYKVLTIQLSDINIVHEPDLTNVRPASTIITEQNLNTEEYEIVKINRNESQLSIKNKLLRAYNSKTIDSITIGIDPGVSIGLAILSGDYVLETTIVLSIRASIDWIRNKIKILKPKSTVVKIGDGIKHHLDQILYEYYRELNEITEIEIVDESNSSIKTSNSTTIHEQSAVIIAKRDGQTYNGRI